MLSTSMHLLLRINVMLDSICMRFDVLCGGRNKRKLQNKIYVFSRIRTRNLLQASWQLLSLHFFFMFYYYVRDNLQWENQNSSVYRKNACEWNTWYMSSTTGKMDIRIENFTKHPHLYRQPTNR